MSPFLFADDSNIQQKAKSATKKTLLMAISYYYLLYIYECPIYWLGSNVQFNAKVPYILALLDA